MRKTIRNLFALIFSTTVFFSCKKISGTGPVVQETRITGQFTEVQSEFSGDVFVTTDSVFHVEIESQQNIIDEMDTKVIDGILTIRAKSNVILRPESKINVYVSLPKTTGLYQSGSGNIKVNGKLSGSDISLKVNGSGNIFINELAANTMTGTVSGSGTIAIYNGLVQSETLKINGSGDVDLKNLQATTSSIDISGSGNAFLFVTNYLKVNISGSGDVYYRGNPSLDIDIHGSGKLKAL